MVWVTRDEFQKGGIVALLFWWAWFKTDEKTESARETIISTSIAAPLAFLLSRQLSVVFPFRLRPIHMPGIHINIPYTLSSDTLIHWSSFPSDHAAIYFTYATGLFLISRRLGWIALAQVLLVICLPRVFLGIHYPTDILAGALVGICAGAVACRSSVKAAIGRPILNWAVVHPGTFCLVFFVYTCQVANSFGWARDVIVLIRNIVVGPKP